MADSSFARARQLAGWSFDVAAVYATGIAAAITAPILIVLLGFLVELTNSRAFRGEWLPGLGPELAALGQTLHVMTVESAYRWLFLLAAPGVLLAAILSLVLYLHYRSVHAAALDAAARLRMQVQKQAFRLGASDLLGTLTSRPEELFQTQAEVVKRGLISWWLTVPRALVSLTLLLLLALWVNWTITIVAIVLAALIYLAHRWLLDRAEKQERLWSERAAQQQKMLLERLRLAPLVAGYGLAQAPGEKFENDLARYEAAELEVRNAGSAAFPITLALILSGSALVLLLIGYQALRQEFSVPGAIVLGTTLVCAYFPWQRISRLERVQVEAEEAAEEIFTYLDRDPTVAEAPGAVPLARLERGVALDHVKLADRQGRALLDDAVVEFPAKKRVALLATDPQTPLALAGMLVRLYDPAAGRVLYDGRDTTSATLSSLRRQCLFVADDGELFTGAVAENIACGDERLTQAGITDAAKLARAYHFVQQLPQGFATLVGPHALPLERSQAFRIGLARAIVREPSLLVVQEPAAPLDEEAAAAIDEALRRLAETTTIIILARRVETIRGADRVYLFHDGKLHAEGPHEELLQKSDLYRHLVYVRFNAFRSVVRE